ncbi:MAG: hypothetical protein K2W95_25405 [Candidatus Obscuribacterales bacterium]|nr:hypothetical protein [Candidatus Obscuribacterales bacterium]
MFHGSYHPEDITLLLEPVPVSKASGTAAGKVTAEYIADTAYEDLFLDAVRDNAPRLARDVAQLALHLHRTQAGDITLVTLIRAGTPTGVLLQKALRQLGHRSTHYSISAVRDRGIDPMALDYILDRHNADSVVFVDGWTGKGFIAQELAESLAVYNASRGTAVQPSLAVLADLAGVAGIAASGDDYLIPFSMMLAPVCGMIGGSFLNTDTAGFDQCLYFDAGVNRDLSQWFVDYVHRQVCAALQAQTSLEWNDARRTEMRAVSDRFVEQCIERFRLPGGRNAVKPGICEANRALLTRNVPMAFLVRNPVEDARDLRNLCRLAGEKRVPVVHWAEMPYRAGVVLNPAASTVF